MPLFHVSDPEISALVTTFTIDLAIFAAAVFYCAYAQRELRQSKRSAWAWLQPVLFSQNDDFIVRRCGVDALEYLKFQRDIIHHLLALTCIAALVLIPVNATAGGERRATNPKPLQYVSAQNIAARSNRLYVHLVVAVVFFFILKRLFVRFQGTVRDSFVRTKRESAVAKYSVEFRNLPRHMVDNMLRSYVEERYPGAILDACVVLDYGFLDSLVEERKLYRKRLDYFLNILLETGQRPRVWGTLVTGVPCCCVRADAIRVYSKRVEKLRIQIDRQLRAEHGSTGIGYVTFNTIRHAQQCLEDFAARERALLPRANQSRTSRVLQEMQVYKWTTRAAPDPSDIIWRNMGINAAARMSRWIVFNVALFITMTMLVTPIAVLGKLEPFMNTVVKKNVSSTFLGSVITDYFPTLVILIINSVLLPYGIDIVAYLEGHQQHSQRERSIMLKNFIFLLLNNLVLPTMALSSINALIAYAEEESQRGVHGIDGIFEIVGSVFLSASGSFFMRYLIQAALFSSAFSLTDLSSVSVRLWSRFVARTPEEERKARIEALEFEFGYNYAFMLGMLAITIVYSVLVPMILPFGLLYFIAKHYTDKYSLFYTRSRTSFDSRGAVGHTALSFGFLSLCLLLFGLCGFYVLQRLVLAEIATFGLFFWSLSSYVYITFYFHPEETVDAKTDSRDVALLDRPVNPEHCGAYEHPALRDGEEEALAGHALPADDREDPHTYMSDDEQDEVLPLAFNVGRD